MKSSASREKRASYLRTFTFGVEDSLVSTVGLLSGVAAANVPRETILLTGSILILVEAFSMAVGSLLSEHSAEEYKTRTDLPIRSSLGLAGIMFVSYFVSGFIPLGPYIFLTGVVAFWSSIILSCVALFGLGLFNAHFEKRNMLFHAFQMAAIGGMAIAVGVIVGGFISR